MQISEKGLSLIKQMEGCILHVYRDIAGVPTLGWGNTRYLDGRKVQMGDPSITQEVADEMLKKTVSAVAEEVDALTTDAINQNQFDALVSCVYNIGTGGYKGSTLRRLVNANPSDPVIREAFLMWTKIRQDNKLVVSSTLKNRRKKEADLYFTE